MVLFDASLLLLAAGGILALISNRNDRIATICGLTGGLGGTLCGAIGAIRAFLTPEIRTVAEVSSTSCVRHIGTFLLPEIRTVAEGAVIQQPEMMAAFFLMPVTILGAFAAIHSVGYLKHHGHGRLGIYWFFYNLMIASMILVFSAEGTPSITTRSWLA